MYYSQEKSGGMDECLVRPPLVDATQPRMTQVCTLYRHIRLSRGNYEQPTIV